MDALDGPHGWGHVWQRIKQESFNRLSGTNTWHDIVTVHAVCTLKPEDTTMNLKSIATLAAAVIASSAWAAAPAETKCGAGTCGKKESASKKAGHAASGASGTSKAGMKDASCSKKDASCSKKEASCSKKDAGCSKK
jgi:hypothetical protein